MTGIKVKQKNDMKNLNYTESTRGITLFQISVNNLATGYVFGLKQKVELVDKMVELQTLMQGATITFLVINI